jgi:hypothetical protein
MTMYRLGLCVLLLPAVLGVAQGQAPSYAKQIRPILSRYCVECHHGSEPESEFNLESFQGLLSGGKRGAAIVPGKADQSLLVRLIEGKQKPTMPPRKARQPTPAEVALVRAWVEAGARDDSGSIKIALPAITPVKAVHTPITALAYEPNGQTLVVSGRGNVVMLDPSGAVRSELPVPLDRVTALAVAPRGTTLAVAGSTEGRTWDVLLAPIGMKGAVGALTRATQHGDAIHTLAFSPDGKILASAGYDRLIKLRDVAANKDLQVLRDHSDAVYSLAFSPDGQLLASGAADRAVKVWKVATGERLYTLGESTDWVYAVAWSPDGKHLAAAGVDRSIRVWEVSAAGGRVVYSVFAHEAPVVRLVYTADGKTLFSLAEDGGLKAWDTARFVERKVYARQSETPLSLAVRPDGKQIAVGRFDGVVALIDPETGKEQHLSPLSLRFGGRGEQKPPHPQPLSQSGRGGQERPAAPPVLTRISPSALVRGRATTLELEGKNLAGGAILSTAPGWKAEVLPGGTAERLKVQVSVPPTALGGVFAVRVKTPAGESGPQTLAVDCFDPVAEVEPNDSPRTGQPIKLPATVVGALSRAGDVDYYRFEAVAGQEIGVQLVAGTAAKFDPLLRLVDPEGRMVVESTNGLLGHTCSRAGTYALGIFEREYRGEPGFTYRLNIGPVPVITSIFPLGVARGKESAIRLEGVFLGKTRLTRLTPPADAVVGSHLPIPLPPDCPSVAAVPSVVVGEFPEVTAVDGGGTVPVPGTANGVLATEGAAQSWRFSARKGERLLLEVNAARLGSPLDSVMEILDEKGKPLPRAVLRSLARTYVAFRDHDSRGSGIRLEAWSELAVNDYLLVGSELLRIRTLPRNPDDDCQFFSEGGQRLGFLGSTPTFHPMGQPMYKVAVHPPGTTFASNGLPLVTLYWRNDDGGPGLGKDSRLVFDPPADGTYQVRILDSRGAGSRAHAYRLTVRPPVPDFSVSVRPTTPAVFRGGAVPIRVSAQRIDEFDEVIHLRLLGLPPGLHAPETTIPAGEKSTAFALYAAADVRLPEKVGPLKLEARALIGGKEKVHTIEVGAPTLIDPGDLVTTTEQTEATVQPGGEVKVTVRVERRNGFKGRVPLEVEGLPHGVRVLDVGLNGILITEAESVRTFVIYAEPWVEPTTHPFVVFARREGKGGEHAARSLLLRVGPGK